MGWRGRTLWEECRERIRTRMEVRRLGGWVRWGKTLRERTPRTWDKREWKMQAGGQKGENGEITHPTSYWANLISKKSLCGVLHLCLIKKKESLLTRQSGFSQPGSIRDLGVWRFYIVPDSWSERRSLRNSWHSGINWRELKGWQWCPWVTPPPKWRRGYRRSLEKPLTSQSREVKS